jgi:general secretion pathway protein E
MLTNYVIDYSLSLDIGLETLTKYNIFPISQMELFTLVAYSKQDHTDIVNSLFNTPVKLVRVSQSCINMQIENFDTLYKIFNLGIKAINHSDQNNSHNSYIIDMIDHIISFAISLKASDIHIEALKQNVVIRFRIDGVLNLMFTFEYNMYPLFASIIKLFASLDISQSRLPQNGRFSKSFNANGYDFRVSTIPTINGESIVLRILDNKNAKITLKEIGFDNTTFEILNKLTKSHQGIILVTGPTGSGKTTTLYSILNTLNTISKKIITIEDPIEYNLTKIQQVNINEDIHLDYSLVLKNILRQDPDIIMIGEIRDEAALKIALQAALTGHLVLATLHTNNAVETITRLEDLNAEPFLISSTLKAVLSQRLVRKICQKCKSQGCKSCNFTGYKSRIVVSELLQCDNQISKYIAKNENIQKIINYAKKNGFKTLEENGMEKVKQGITSLEEFYSQIKI